ncbi:MAG: DUF4268 domain-containing protein [Thermodesulfobacteriota bacterium]
MAIGRSDCHISLVVDSREDKVRCELYIPDSKELYQTLISCRADIENELAITEPLEWLELPGRRRVAYGLFKGFVSLM